MFKLVLSIILAIGVLAPQARASEIRTYEPYASGESPFPWGTESPFPWKIVDGLWKTTTAPLYFEMSVINCDHPTSRYMRVTLLDRRGKVIAAGVGVMRDKDQIIRARVIGDKLDAYALIRAYNRRQSGAACRVKECVMVATLREKDASKSKDLHYLLEKASHN